MLIRLMSDFTKNPSHYDKLIAIDGLPEEWIFWRKKMDGPDGQPEDRLFLKLPWEIDPSDNIPDDIKMKFQAEPMTVWFETPQEIRPGTFGTQELGWVRWIEKAYGLRLNLQTNQGKAMWDQILDLLDRETPRSQRIPEAAIVGDKMQWLLKAANVPYVKLTGGIMEVPADQAKPIPPPPPIPRPNEFACRNCGDVFDKERGRWMHERRKHGVKDPFIPERKAVLA